jgi:hypothetical protein
VHIAILNRVQRADGADGQYRTLDSKAMYRQRDAEWGGAFWKTNAYAPYPIWIWLNGHEWAKRQLAKAGIGFTALGNGFASCQDPVLLQRVCDRLGPGAVTAFFWRWQRRLPSPFTREDLRAGYVYELAFRQFEVSDTRVFDRPAAGRAFFEGLIRDHLDVGRPDQVSLVFGRKVRLTGPHPTPGTFRTHVITKGAGPRLVCFYKSARLKQYFKQHRALRTETVISDTRDFGIGRRLTYKNWNALRDVGEHANQRLCDAEAADAMPAPDVATLNQVTRPSRTPEGQHAPALRFGNARLMALMAATTGFCHLITGSGQPRPRPADARPARRGLPQPPGHLRPQTAPPQTHHLPHPRQPPLPAHPARPRHRGALS